MDCVHDIRGDGVCDRCGAEIFSHEGLKQDLRKIYERIPELPVREETMWAATDALTAFCIMLGNHGIDPANEPDS